MLAFIFLLDIRALRGEERGKKGIGEKKCAPNIQKGFKPESMYRSNYNAKSNQESLSQRNKNGSPQKSNSKFWGNLIDPDSAT